jgi:hypothetical protein
VLGSLNIFSFSAEKTDCLAKEMGCHASDMKANDIQESDRAIEVWDAPLKSGSAKDPGFSYSAIHITSFGWCGATACGCSFMKERQEREDEMQHKCGPGKEGLRRLRVLRGLRALGEGLDTVLQLRDIGLLARLLGFDGGNVGIEAGKLGVDVFKALGDIALRFNRVLLQKRGANLLEDGGGVVEGVELRQNHVILALLLLILLVARLVGAELLLELAVGLRLFFKLLLQLLQRAALGAHCGERAQRALERQTRGNGRKAEWRGAEERRKGKGRCRGVGAGMETPRWTSRARAAGARGGASTTQR